MTENKNFSLGKKNRASGASFERRVRADLERKGWVVGKWHNNVAAPFEQAPGEWHRSLEPCKAKWNNFTKRVMMTSGGFPDFIAYRLYPQEIIGVECKINGYLTRDEQDKVKWLLQNKIFSKILVAKKNNRKILYLEK